VTSFSDEQRTAPDAAPRGAARDGPPLALSLIRLARPAQWSKSVFVLIGPFYAFKDLPPGTDIATIAVPALIAALAFALASSACYVINDLIDRRADQLHPRKRRRPIAAGHVSTRTAWIYAACLFAGAAGLTLALSAPSSWLVGVALLAYVANVLLYSAYTKHKVIADVIGLSLGFVIRVLAGCAAAMIEPSIWLLNVTLFLSMLLAFGKRLGERRTLGMGSAPGDVAAEHRRVQAGYTDAILQMAVIATAVMTLMTYSLYVREQATESVSYNLLMWSTLLPATYGLLRCVIKLEQGAFDDPTELALHDRGFQAAGALFFLLTLALMWWRLSAGPAPGPAG